MLALAERRHIMIEFQHRIEIDRSPAEVFALLSDVERLPEWQRSVVAVRRITPGLLGAGSEFEQALKAMGRMRHVRTRVVAYRAPELIAFAADAGFADYYCGLELTPVAHGRTSLVSRNEFRLHGLWRIARPMLAAEIRREVVGELGELKRIIEAGRGATLPAMSAG
jgi:uncharacterized protein YndB with AHSA1/START domain